MRRPEGRTEAMQREIEHQVWMALCRTENSWDIAQTFGITENEVKAIKRKMERRYDATNEAAFKGAKLSLIARHEYLYECYIRGYIQSQEQAQVTTSGRATYDSRNGEVVPLPDQVVTQQRAEGNPAFLSGAAAQLEKVGKILGVDAAQKVEVTNVDPSADAAAAQSKLAQIFTGVGAIEGVGEAEAALTPGQPETPLQLGVLGTPEPVRTTGN